MPGFELKLIARGFEITTARRENLYELTYELVKMFSEHKDLDRLAEDMIILTKDGDELQFMCFSFDAVLKKYYKSPSSARSVLFTSLFQIIFKFIR